MRVFLSIGITMLLFAIGQLHARGTGDRWNNLVLPGVYTEIEASQRKPNEMPFVCYPPCDKACVVIVWLPNPYGQLQGSYPKPEDRAAYWIPSLNRGYTDIRFNGCVADPVTHVIRHNVTETSKTQVVATEAGIQDWLESDTK